MTARLGPRPPQTMIWDATSRWVSPDYAYWQRRRAEQAEALLRELVGMTTKRTYAEVLLDVEAHFKEVQP